MRRIGVNPADFGQMGFDFSQSRPAVQTPVNRLPFKPPVRLPMLATGGSGGMLPPTNVLLQGAIPPTQLPAVRQLPAVSPLPVGASAGGPVVAGGGRVPPRFGNIPTFGSAPKPPSAKGLGLASLALMGGEAMYNDMLQAESDPELMALRAQQARDSAAGEFAMYGDGTDWNMNGDYMLSPPSTPMVSSPSQPVGEQYVEPNPTTNSMGGLSTVKAMGGFTPTAMGEGLDYTPANFAPLDVPDMSHISGSSYVAPTWSDNIDNPLRNVSSGFTPSQFSDIAPLPATNFSPMNVPQARIPARRPSRPQPQQSADMRNGVYQGGLPPHMRQGSPSYTVAPSVTTSATGVPGQVQVNLNQRHLRFNDPEYQRLYALQEARAREVLAKQGISYEQALAHAVAGTQY